uniref:Brevican core protein n=1 Tax=Denticeps clupeoides TaxID=299321 RepID=A0AAY4DQB7_9TELE
EMFQSLLLSSICLLVSLSTATADHASEDTRLLQVIIHKTPPPSAILGGSLTLPCLVSHPLPTTSTLGRHAVLSMPRVKWSVLSSKRETEILVARGERVKVNEAYKNRARLLNYASSPTDLTLQLDDLNHNDTGFYRCEVQHGLEDAHDLVHIKVKGVVFHYRHASSRYAFTFDQAQDACEDIGAQIATPEQLLAEYNSGYEQCDAGWLADGSVRYPIQMPREGCFGDMDGMPGVRNYGMLDPYELYDVYCYVENIKGEVIHGPIPQRLTLAEAKAFCESKDAELATTGQLYAAWNDGLNHCSPGWLADGSVRYPIVIPRERCGGSEPGVKTVYRYNNQTGFPEPHTHHDVYCFRATEPDHLGEDIVTMTDPQEEFSFGQVTQQAENEALGAVEFIPLSSISDVGTEADQLPTQIYPKDHTLPDSQTADFISMIPESTQGPWQVSTNQVSLESVPQTYWKARDTDRSEDDYTYQHPEDSKGSKGHNDNGDACMENPCANGGTCVENGSTPRCLCLPTYGGDFCQVDLEHCEPGWEKFQGSCYRHFTKRQSWEVAEKHCRMCGGHLVSLMTPEEQEFINDKYREYQWTGLNDRTIEGDFRWSDGNPLLYENWYRGQPDSYFLSGENCVVMVWHDDGHWSDVPCNYHLSYTCKKGISFCGKPPTVLHGKTFGRRRLRYETNSKVRYYCQGGFVQRQNPVIKCLPTGKWEKPLVTCTPGNAI